MSAGASQGRRPLTPGEVDLARTAFGSLLPYERIRLICGARGNPIAAIAFRQGNSAITLGRTVHIRAAYYLDDFASAKAAARGLFIHELAHVLQYRELGTPRFLARYGREFAACGFKAWRMYEYEEGVTPFARTRLEAQAQMAGDYTEALALVDTARLTRIAANLRGSGLFGL